MRGRSYGGERSCHIVLNEEEYMVELTTGFVEAGHDSECSDTVTQVSLAAVEHQR